MEVPDKPLNGYIIKVEHTDEQYQPYATYIDQNDMPDMSPEAWGRLMARAITNYENGKGG